MIQIVECAAVVRKMLGVMDRMRHEPDEVRLHEHYRTLWGKLANVQYEKDGEEECRIWVGKGENEILSRVALRVVEKEIEFRGIVQSV